MARPMLDRWEMPGVETIQTQAQRQTAGALPTRRVIAGTVWRRQDRGFLDALRALFTAAEPVAFVPDIETPALVHVLIEDLQVEENKHNRIRYTVTLVESPPPGSAGASPDNRLNAEAGALMTGLAALGDLSARAALPALTDLSGAVGSPPDPEAVRRLYDLNVAWEVLAQPVDQALTDLNQVAAVELDRALRPALEMRVSLPAADGWVQAKAGVESQTRAALEAAGRVPAGEPAAVAEALQRLELPDVAGQLNQVTEGTEGALAELAHTGGERALGPLLQAADALYETLQCEVAEPLAQVQSELEEVCIRLETEPAALVAQAVQQVQEAVAPAAAGGGPVYLAEVEARQVLEALQAGRPVEELLAARVAGATGPYLDEVRRAQEGPLATLRAAMPDPGVVAAADAAREHMLALAAQIAAADWTNELAAAALVDQVRAMRQELTRLQEQAGQAADAVRSSLAQSHGDLLAEELVQTLCDLADVRPGGADPTGGALRQVLIDLQGSTAKLDLSKSAGRIAAEIHNAAEELKRINPARDAGEATQALTLAQPLCADIEQARGRALVALQQVMDGAGAALARTAGSLEQVRQALQAQMSALQGGTEAVAATAAPLATALPEAFHAVAGAVAHLRQTLSGENGAVDQLRLALGQLEQALAALEPERLELEAAVRMEPVLWLLRGLHIAGPLELILQAVADLARKVAAIRFDELNPLARETALAVRLLLEEEAQEGLPPVRQRLLARLDEVSAAGPERLLAEGGAAWQAVLDQVAPVDPAGWLAEAEPRYKELGGALAPLEPKPLLEALQQACTRVAGWLESTDPAVLLAPLHEAYQTLLTQVDELQPAALLAEAYQLRSRVQEVLVQVGTGGDPANGGDLAGRLTALLERLQRAISLVEPALLLAPAHAAVAEAGAAVERLNPETFFALQAAAATALAGAAAALTPEALARLEAELDRTLAPVIDLQAGAVDPVAQALAALERAVTAIGPGALVHVLRPTAYTVLRNAVDEAAPPAERLELLNQLKAEVAAMDPLKLLAPLLDGHDEAAGLTRELRITWNEVAGEVQVLAGEARDAILGALPAWAGERPLLQEQLAAGLQPPDTAELVASLKRLHAPLSGFAAAQQARLNQLAADLAPLVAGLTVPVCDPQALGQALNAAVAALQEVLRPAFALEALEQEFTPAGAALAAQARTLDPAGLDQILTPALAAIRSAMATLDPAPLQAALDLIYYGQVRTALEAAAPRPLVEPELTERYAGLVRRLQALNLRYLAAPALRELERLQVELSGGLEQAERQLQALPGQIAVAV